MPAASRLTDEGLEHRIDLELLRDLDSSILTSILTKVIMTMFFAWSIWGRHFMVAKTARNIGLLLAHCI